MTPKVPIWDLPVRLVHWLLVLLLPAAWWTAEEGDLDLHYSIGTWIVFLLVFRLVWGLIGSSTARFSRFVRGPSAIAAYVRGRAPPAVGHNPVGALSVLALLLALATQVLLGLFSTDEDGLQAAPLSHLVDYETSEAAAELHEANFNIILVLVGLHVAAILYYAVVRRQNLVTPMVTGRGPGPDGAEPMVAAGPIRALVALLVAAGVIFWIWS